MSGIKVIKGTTRDIKVVGNPNKGQYITSRDAAMDARAKQAVREAVSRAEFCQKPVAKYDAESKKAYLQYPDGRRVDVR